MRLISSSSATHVHFQMNLDEFREKVAVYFRILYDTPLMEDTIWHQICQLRKDDSNGGGRTTANATPRWIQPYISRNCGCCFDMPHASNAVSIRFFMA